MPRAQRGDRTRNLEFLFEALKVAPDDTSAKHIEERIWSLWVVSGSDTANLLMTRVKTAVEAQDLDLAIKLLELGRSSSSPTTSKGGTGARRSTT